MRVNDALPKWASAIQARRKELGLTQEALASRSGDLLAQRTISDLERGAINPLHLKAERFYALLRALKWTPEEFAEATGLEIVPVYEHQESLGTATVSAPTSGAYVRVDEAEVESERGRPVIPGGLVMVPVVGAANGGRPMEYAIPVQKELVRPNTFAFEVHGDSMDDGSETAIKDGDWVLVDTSLTDPVPGKVFLVELEGDGYTVKRLRKIGDQYWLVSDNPEGESIPLDRIARIVGQVYRKVSYQEVR